MAKPKDLHSKLKASDRRRRRRPTAMSATPSTQQPPSLDVTGLLVDAVLTVKIDSNHCQDAIAISALRGCSRGKPPNGTEASQLYQQLQQIASRDDVATREFRRALDQLLSLSAQHSGKGDETNTFVNYLEMLVS